MKRISFLRVIKFFLFAAVLLSAFSVSAKVKAKLKKNIVEDNVQITVLKEINWKQPFSFNFMGARLVGVNVDRSVRYYLELNQGIEDDDFIVENLIVKFEDESIVEVPFAYTTLKVFELTDEPDKYLKEYIKFAQDTDLDDEYFVYSLTEEMLDTLVKGKVVKMRVVGKNKFDDMPVYSNDISTYLESGAKVIKEKQDEEFTKIDNHSTLKLKGF